MHYVLLSNDCDTGNDYGRKSCWILSKTKQIFFFSREYLVVGYYSIALVQDVAIRASI
jgi:hypothetical protein